MKKLLCLLTVFGMMCAVSAEEKTGYVNLLRLFERYYRTIQENAQFEVRKQSLDAKGKVLREEYMNTLREARQAEEEMKNELLASKVREDAKVKFEVLRGRLQEKDMELRRFSQEGIRDLQQARNRIEEALIEDLLEQVKHFAKENGYTHVYEISGRNLNRVPTLIVYPEEKEITAQLEKLINVGHEKDLEIAIANLKELRKKSEQMQNQHK